MLNYRLKNVSLGFLIAFGAGILGVEVNAEEVKTYKYDALGRLVETSTQGTVNNGLNTTIQFDKAGNRINYKVTGSTTLPAAGRRVIVIPLNGFTVIPID